MRFIFEIQNLETAARRSARIYDVSEDWRYADNGPYMICTDKLNTFYATTELRALKMAAAYVEFGQP